MTDFHFLNGKSYAQRTTGVQRVAGRLIQALDEHVSGLPGHWMVLCPPGAKVPRLGQIRVQIVGPACMPLHLWEQLVLPLAASRGRLINFAGSAPWLAGRQVTMIHDAAVFDQPNAYTPLFRAWYRTLFQKLARGAGLLTVSEFSRQRLACHLAIDPARIHVVRPGAEHLNSVAPDGEVLNRLGISGQPYLLTVGSRNPAKNVEALVSAIGGLQGKAKLVIVGGANERVFSRSLPTIDPPGVIRAGVVDDASLVALYRGAAALVLPSHYEGFGLPAVEAMSLGCPVVLSNAASLPEVGGSAALYFNPSSIEEMTDVLRRVLQEPALRATLRAKGYERAAGFRWAAAAHAVLAALNCRASV